MIVARSSLFSRLCVALSVAAGFAVVYAIAAVWIGQLVQGYLAKEPKAAFNQKMLVEPNGTVLILAFDGPQWRYLTLDGQSASSESETTQIFGSSLVATRDRPAAGAQDLNQEGWAGCIFPLADNAMPPTYWYFVISDDSVDGRGYFAGYNAETRLAAGYFGRQGLTSTAPARNDQFPIDGARFRYGNTLIGFTALQSTGFSPAGPAVFQPAETYPPWIVYLHSGGELLKFDLAVRTVGKALEADDIVSTGKVQQRDPSAAMPANSRNPMLVIQKLALRRPGRITMLNPADGSTEDYRLPAELGDQDFTFYPTQDRTAVIDIWHWADPTRRNEHDLFWINAKGEITRRETVSLTMYRTSRTRLDINAPFLAFPVPLFWGCLWATSTIDTEQPNGIPLFADVWPGALFIVLTTLCGCVLTDRRLRRSGLARSYSWLAFVLLLGFPGYVGFLLHRAWQIHPPVPTPERTGIEVFA